jgi:hypothetical protein
MSDPANRNTRTQAVIELMVISEIMIALGVQANGSPDEVPASWMTFLGSAVGNAADRLAEDGT